MINLNSVPFTIYDDLGNIIASGYCQRETYNLQVLNDGEYILQVPSNPATDIVNTITKEIVFNGKLQEPVTYIESRQSTYPSVTEQLDMLWHAMDNNSIPKAEPFYSTIKTVKEAYPKDNSAVPNSTNVVIL
jgi:hypothetical protein